MNMKWYQFEAKMGAVSINYIVLTNDQQGWKQIKNSRYTFGGLYVLGGVEIKEETAILRINSRTAYFDVFRN